MSAAKKPALTSKKRVTKKHARDEEGNALNKDGTRTKMPAMQHAADKGSRGDKCVELVTAIVNSEPGDELYEYKPYLRLVGDTPEQGWEFIRKQGSPWDRPTRRVTHKDMFALFGGPHGMNLSLTAKQIEKFETIASKARKELKISQSEFHETDPTKSVNFSAKYLLFPKITFLPTTNRAKMAIYRERAAEKKKKSKKNP